MRFIRNLSLKRKLACVNVLATALALLVACALFMVCDVLTFRRAMIQDASIYADMVGANSTAAVSFRDEAGAAEVLSALRAEPHVRAACLYTPDGKVFASYRSSGSEPPFAEGLVGAFGHRFADGRLELLRPVELGGQRICWVYVRTDLEEFYRRVKLYAGVLAIVFLASLGAAVVAAGKLQRHITEPVLHLARTAREVSAGKNYAVRAVKRGDDELGQLTDDFNEMLEQIRRRDAELQRHKDHLEEQVLLRTQELLSMNGALTEARDAAEAASHAKSAFLANMSHEIRTPMTAILGFADLLLEPGQDMSERLNCVQTIRRNSEHLLAIINDVLDISKIEAGKMTVERVACSPAQVVTDVASLMRVKAAEKDLMLSVTFDGPIPQAISSDPTRLRQILINLAGNAVKFTHKGEIHLKVHLDAARPDLIHFVVRDSGVGIDPAHRAKLFQPFTQADVSTTRRFGGTGLGLTISKCLANMLGGEITVESRPGEGSTFDVSVETGPLDGVAMLHGLEESTFPAQGALAATPANSPAAAERLGGRILLAEDGPDNQRLISHHLRKAGARVTIAENGALAVEMAMAAEASGEPFGMIFMDMQMPELDGYGATAKLRSRGLETPVVALTAHAMASDREKCLMAGCTDYLTKPVDRTMLLAMAVKYLVPSASVAGDVATRIRSRYADDSGLGELVAHFVQKLPERVRELQSLLDGRDLTGLKERMHQMKGAAGGYGFPDITRLAAAAEQAIERDGDADALAARVRELVELIARVDGYAPPDAVAGAALAGASAV